MHSDERSSRRRKLLTILVVAVVLVAGAVFGYYWFFAPFSSTSGTASSRSPAIGLQNSTLVAAAGEVNGPGGCSAPGAGKIEYCYSFDVVFIPGSQLVSAGQPTSNVASISTANVTFAIQAGSGVNVSFVNFTLLAPSSGILAAYTPAGGWAAQDSNSLPITFAAGQTLILNYGTSSASGDAVVVYEGPWGEVRLSLP